MKELQRFIVHLVMAYIAPIAVMVAVAGKADLPDPWPSIVFMTCIVWMVYWGMVATITDDR